ncbi:MAG: hypothetical protein ACQESS_00395 [Bacillota bacterium]
MKNTARFLMLFLLFSLLIPAQLSAQLSPIDQNRIKLADDLNLLSEALFYKNDIIKESTYQDWIIKTFDKKYDFDAVLNDENTVLEYREMAAYLVTALDQKEFAETYEMSPELNYWRAAEVLELFSDIDENISLDDQVNMLNALRGLFTALNRANIHNQPLGNLNDSQIYTLMEDNISDFYSQNLLETDAEELFALGNYGLVNIPGGIFTGYTIKNPIERPLLNFNKTIRYGHASLSHLRQMLSILRRENFKARIAVESRTSSYVHLIDEWGTPASDVNHTPINESKTVVHADEYDLLIEFDQKEEMHEFASIIEEYAKKEESGQPGLIKDSWFVPLFTSEVELPGYVPVSEVRVENKGYALISYALPENAETIVDYFENYKDQFKIETNKVWINRSFLSYLEVNTD